MRKPQPGVGVHRFDWDELRSPPGWDRPGMVGAAHALEIPPLCSAGSLWGRPRQSCLTPATKRGPALCAMRGCCTGAASRKTEIPQRPQRRSAPGQFGVWSRELPRSGSPLPRMRAGVEYRRMKPEGRQYCSRAPPLGSPREKCKLTRKEHINFDAHMTHFVTQTGER